MQRRRLFYQLFPSYLGILIIAVFTLIWFASRSLHEFYYQEREAGLEARAILVGHKISADSIKSVSYLTKVSKILGQTTGTRITIISPDGIVLGDSHENSQMMDNHQDRPEVALAFAGKTGTSIRYSHTLEQEMMYLAIRVKMDEGAVIVRTSVPITTLQETFSAMKGKIIFGGVIIVLVAALMNFLVSRQIARPLEEMKRGAEKFAHGELSHKLFVPGTEEVGALANTLNQMAKQLDARIKTILGQSNEREAILSSMIEGVLAVDMDERIISLNAAAAALLKIDKPSIVGETVQASVRNTELHQFIRDILSGQEHREPETIFASTTNLYLKITGTILRGAAGSQIGALIVLNDITRIRQLENIRRDFVANVSHELKTPITSIKGYVETLMAGAAENPEHRDRFLGVVNRQADRLDAIINDLLELAHIEQREGDSDIPMELKSVIIVLDGAIQDCMAQADRKQVKVKNVCDKQLVASMNAPLLQQAIVNLLGNAIKYSDTGQTVLVSARQDEDVLVIAVQDYGVGIAEEHFERLFERFYRVDKARSQKLGGTGLGLAIVKHIAQIHGGSVSIKSKPGEGSTFSINLPMKLT